MVIILVPISFITRGSLILNKDEDKGRDVFTDKNFLEVQITFQWYIIGINLTIAVSICIMTCMALSTLKYFFASSMRRQIR